MNKKETKTVDFFLKLNYPITFYTAEEGGYVAEIEDLPGCIVQGENLQELHIEIEKARQLWIQTAYDDGIQIPLPRDKREYSGKFIARIPKYLHQQLSELAEQEGVSLNQLVETILSVGTVTHEQNKKLDNIIEKIGQLDRKISGTIQPMWTTPTHIIEISELKHRHHSEFGQIQLNALKEGVTAA
jgi:antitoxin HicB